MNKTKLLLSLIPMRIWLYTIGIVIALIFILMAVHRCTTSTSVRLEQSEKIDITPNQIRQIVSIGEWQFLSVDDEELADTVHYGFWGDDKLVRIYYGTLRLGINMQAAPPRWITMQNDTLCVRLPGIRLLDNDFIDEARTKSFIEEGSWSDADRERLYQQAYRQMKARCLTKENIAAAEDNARAQFYNMLRSMGFEKVKIEFENNKSKQ